MNFGKKLVFLSICSVVVAMPSSAAAKCQPNSNLPCTVDAAPTAAPRILPVLQPIDAGGRVVTPVREASGERFAGVTWVEAVDWTALFVATLLAWIVSMYPVLFYITMVWPSRQRTIFNTLSLDAREDYIRIYHGAERFVVKKRELTDAEEQFAALYDRWFGRGRLIAPAVIVGLLMIAYCFLVVVAAGKTLFAEAVTGIVEIPFVAVAAMTGAYILVSLETIGRVTRRDLLPDDLYLSALRLAAAVPLGYAFAVLVGGAAAPFVALAITAFPLHQIGDFLRRLASQRLGLAPQVPFVSNDVPSRLSGVDHTVCERLSAIGVDTITQLAYSDPVLLTMRTSLSFVFVLDVVSQALAWVYLEGRLDKLRPMGLRGSFELAVLSHECQIEGPAGDNARALCAPRDPRPDAGTGE